MALLLSSLPRVVPPGFPHKAEASSLPGKTRCLSAHRRRAQARKPATAPSPQGLLGTRSLLEHKRHGAWGFGRHLCLVLEILSRRFPGPISDSTCSCACRQLSPDVSRYPLVLSGRWSQETWSLRERMQRASWAQGVACFPRRSSWTAGIWVSAWGSVLGVRSKAGNARDKSDQLTSTAWNHMTFSGGQSGGYRFRLWP